MPTGPQCREEPARKPRRRLRGWTPRPAWVYGPARRGGPAARPFTSQTETGHVAYKIMILGASYGSLLASKILFGGHSVHLICLPNEADLINSEGFRVRLPVRGRKDQVLIDSRELPGKVTAGGTTSASPKDFDLIGLAMQE